MIIYIAGRMRGCPNYEKRFKEAEEELKKQGHVVLNPAMLPKGLAHTRYMPICLSMIDAADAVYMLYGWEDSEGAKVEKLYAEYNEKLIAYEKTPEIIWENSTGLKAVLIND